MTHSTMKRFCASALLGLMLSTTAVPVIGQTLDEFAARGEILAAADPLAAELRSRLDEAGRRGFDIGMGGTEGDTAYGPGKQARGDALPADQQPGYFKAVEYSITRNGNLEALLTGGRVAQGNPTLKDARLAEDDPFYTLGFDIATGLLYNLQGGIGDISQTVGARGVRDTLSGATQRGFDASARLNGRNFVSKSSGSTAISTPPGNLEVSDSTTDGTAGVDRVGSVPNVVGMIAEEAETALSYAGYGFKEVEVAGFAQPPYDRVLGTRPAGGTTLPRESTVEVEVPRAWLRKGEGTLISSDPRIGFDLDTGKDALVVDGADIFANTRTAEKHRAYDPTLRLTSFSPGPGVTMVPAYKIDGSNPSSAITHRVAYRDCVRAFREKPHTAVESPFEGHLSEFCIGTKEHHTVRLSITKDREGNFNFRYATFAGNGGIVKAQGRVVVPGAPVKKLPICEAAKLARDRGSPATPGLTKQCLDSGGTVPQ